MDIDKISELSNETINKKSAIGMFGSDKLKASFEKYREIKNSNMEDALIKTMKQYFDSVKKEKVGRAYHYKLGNAYDTIQKREDNRDTNGKHIKNELPFSKYMDTSVVMSIYEDDLFIADRKYEATLTNWMYNFGFVNKELYILKTAPDCKEAINIKKRLESDNGKKISSIELQRFFEDYIQNRSSLFTIIDNMRKEGLISFYKVPKAVYKNGDKAVDPNNPDKSVHSTSIATITQETADIIDKKQDELRDIHNLAMYQLVSNRNSKKVRKRIGEYEEDLKEFFKNDLQLELADTNEVIDNELVNFYYSYVIVKKCTNDELLGYIRDKRPETYYQYVNDYEGFVNSAREARNETLFKKAGIKQNEELERISADFNLSKHRGYWEDSYMDSVVKLEKSLYPDFVYYMYKKKSYRNYKDTLNESKIDKETMEIMLEEQLA